MLDLGFGSGTIERFRFNDIYAPEIVGRALEQYLS